MEGHYPLLMDTELSLSGFLFQMRDYVLIWWNPFLFDHLNVGSLFGKDSCFGLGGCPGAGSLCPSQGPAGSCKFTGKRGIWEWLTATQRTGL